MKVLAYGVIFLISFLLQFKIAPLFSIADIQPDFLLITVIAVAFRENQIWGALSGCGAGLLWDILGTGFIGLSALSNSVAGYLAGFLAGKRVERRLSILIGLLLVTIFTHDLIYFFILDLGAPISPWKVLIRYVLPTTAYTFSIALMVHMVLPSGLWSKSRRND